MKIVNGNIREAVNFRALTDSTLPETLLHLFRGLHSPDPV